MTKKQGYKTVKEFVDKYMLVIVAEHHFAKPALTRYLRQQHKESIEKATEAFKEEVMKRRYQFFDLELMAFDRLIRRDFMVINVFLEWLKKHYKKGTLDILKRVVRCKASPTFFVFSLTSFQWQPSGIMNSCCSSKEAYS